MKKLKAERAHYKIRKCIGIGLTSQVYEAYRVDNRGWTKHRVALKIIRSRNDVQILRKEFEQLSQLDSPNCVKLIAWENLNWGPAIVLEFVDGCTLEELIKKQTLSVEMVVEIFLQASKGLNDLHALDLVHGDLNLKNIMIDRRGIVRLIDFGFQGNEGEYYTTPEFASPERLNGAKPSKQSDLYALEQVIKFTTKKNLLCVDLKTILESLAIERPSEATQLLLASAVKASRKIENLSTRIFKNPQKRKLTKIKMWVCTMIAGLLLPFATSFAGSPQKRVASIELRGVRWFSYSINGLPSKYGPLSTEWLRPGVYELKIENDLGNRNYKVDLKPGQTFLLNLE